MAFASIDQTLYYNSSTTAATQHNSVVSVSVGPGEILFGVLSNAGSTFAITGTSTAGWVIKDFSSHSALFYFKNTTSSNITATLNVTLGTSRVMSGIFWLFEEADEMYFLKGTATSTSIDLANLDPGLGTKDYYAITLASSASNQSFSTAPTGYNAGTGTGGSRHVQQFTQGTFTASARNPTAYSGLSGGSSAVAAWNILISPREAISADTSITLGNFTTTGAASLSVNAQASASLGNFTTTAAASLPITGALTTTLGPFTTVASASLPVNGNLAVTLGNFTMSATGLVTGDGLNALITLGDFTTASAASLSINADGQVTLGAFTTTAALGLDVHASAAVTLGNFTTSATIATEIHAGGVVNLQLFTTTASGSLRITAIANGTLGPFTVTARLKFIFPAVTPQGRIARLSFSRSSGRIARVPVSRLAGRIARIEEG